MSPIKLIKIAAKTTEEVRLEKKAKFKKKAWLLKKHGRHIFFLYFLEKYATRFFIVHSETTGRQVLACLPWIRHGLH